MSRSLRSSSPERALHTHTGAGTSEIRPAGTAQVSHKAGWGGVGRSLGEHQLATYAIVWALANCDGMLADASTFDCCSSLVSQAGVPTSLLATRFVPVVRWKVVLRYGIGKGVTAF